MILSKRKMIKKLIEKIFGKFCKCEEPIILEDEEKYLENEAEMAQYLEDKIIEPVKIDHCGTHLWYKKSCPECREAIK